jgi:hypothetical protein
MTKNVSQRGGSIDREYFWRLSAHIVVHVEDGLGRILISCELLIFPIPTTHHTQIPHIVNAFKYADATALNPCECVQ